MWGGEGGGVIITDFKGGCLSVPLLVLYPLKAGM